MLYESKENTKRSKRVQTVQGVITEQQILFEVYKNSEE